MAKYHAYYQEVQKLRGIEDKEWASVVDEFEEPLPPFDRADFNKNAKTLKHSRGLDVVDYKNNLCYEYDELRFDGKTPSEFFNSGQDFAELALRRASTLFRAGGLLGRSGKCEEVCTVTKGQEDCEAVCDSDKPGEYFVKVYVAVVMPRVAPSGVFAFSLCQGGKCVNSGTVSTFGDSGGHNKLQAGEVVDDKKFFIVENDVTDVMVKKGWSFKKPLEAKMIDKVMSYLPEPVVIIKKLGKGGKVISSEVKFSPKEKPKRYGNLLDEYSI